VRGRVLWPDRAEATAALLSAALFAFAFPPFRLIVPAFICLVPIAIMTVRHADEGGPVQGAVRTWFWFGLIGYGCNLYWIAVALSLWTNMAFAGYIAALIWLAPWVAAAGAALYTARKLTRWPLTILLPVVWCALELGLNHLSDLSFPWLPLGLSLARFPMAVQLADLSGVRGVTFWIAMSNGLVADAYLLRYQRRAMVMRLLAIPVAAAIALSYGAWRMATTEIRPLAPIAIVQPNVSEREKLSGAPERPYMDVLAEATRAELGASDPRLVIWPEAALPGYLGQQSQWRDSLRALASAEKTPILFGVVDYVFTGPNTYAYYNAAMLTDSLGRLGSTTLRAFASDAASRGHINIAMDLRAQADSVGTGPENPPYHKRFLVPVVERVPFLNPEWFSGIDYFGGFGRGELVPPYALPFGKVGVLICYESVFLEHSRHFRRAGADLLVNITNDAWFGRSTAPYQHHAHLILRAIENRVGVVRAANTGISGYIDPLGRVRAETELEVPIHATYMAETTDVRTLYVRLGDWLGFLSLLATTAAVVAYNVRRRRAA
jgi:apolipoprotein N-acyltransferase